MQAATFCDCIGYRVQGRVPLSIALPSFCLLLFYGTSFLPLSATGLFRCSLTLSLSRSLSLSLSLPCAMHAKVSIRNAIGALQTQPQDCWKPQAALELLALFSNRGSGRHALSQQDFAPALAVELLSLGVQGTACDTRFLKGMREELM